MSDSTQSKNKKTFFLLWLLCVVGLLGSLPYILYLKVLPQDQVLRFVIFYTAQSSLFFALICWISSKILPRTDLQPFRTNSPLRQIFYPALVAGGVVGLSIWVLDHTLLKSPSLSQIHPPRLVGLLSSLYGSINEEVLLRLFLLTTLYFTINRCFQSFSFKRDHLLWAATLVAALIFGLAHLPLAFKLTQPTALDLFRILFLNTAAGVVFGWLYWSKSIWTAMIAHFVADLIIHVFFI